MKLEDKLEELKAKKQFIENKIKSIEVLKGEGVAEFANFIGYNEGGEIHKRIDWRLNLIIKRHRKKKPKELLIIMINMPREWGKTTLYNKVRIVKEIIKNPKINCLIVSSKKDLAKDMLTPVKMLFEKNQMIRTYYGDYVGNKWTDGEILVSPAEDNQIPDNVYTVETAGVDSNIASKRYDLIIIDDIIGKNNKDDSAFLEMARKTVKTLIPLLRNGGIMYILFMRWGENDFYSELMKEFKNQSYLIRITDVLRDNEGNPLDKDGNIVSEDSPKRVPLFPEKFPLNVLDQRRDLLKDYMYSCHYAQFPKMDTFKLMDFKQLKRLDKKEYDDLINNIMLGKIPKHQLACIIDSQNSLTEKSNYFGVAFWYYNGERFILFDLYKIQGLYHEITDYLTPIIIKYGTNVFCEKSGAASNFLYNLRNGLNKYGRNDIVIDYVSHKGIKKQIRILSMQPFLNTGVVYIPPEKKAPATINSDVSVDMIKQLQKEMSLFPQEGSNIEDDLIDACFGFTCDVFNIDSEFFVPKKQLEFKPNITKPKTIDELNVLKHNSYEEGVIYI